MARPSQARLDLNALQHNVAHAQHLAPGAKLMAVVKANAYGHGSLTVARALDGHADAFAVASLEEAALLREGGVQQPVLLLEGVFAPGELDSVAALDLWLTIAGEEQLAWLEEARLPRPLQCWLKVDTGMHRLGVNAHKADALYQRLSACRNSQGTPVLFTHLACADYATSTATSRQLALFDSLTADAPRSAANSAGLLAWPDSHYNWVRPGYMLYGNSPMLEAHANAAALKPVMTLASAVIALRDIAPGEAVGYGGTWVATRPSRIATVAIGYGDGYPRQAANGTPVLVDGQPASLAGRVSMDMITVDVTGLRDIRCGSEVILWGAGLPLNTVAEHASSSGYELITRMPTRTPRVVLAETAGRQTR